MPLELFSKSPLPDVLPEEMQAIVNELKQSPNQEACLRKAYNILITKYRGVRVKTYTRLFEAFTRDLGKLWRKNGFLHCTNINYVLRALLITSGWFKEADIRLVWTQIWLISPHQYLQVKVGEQWINIDIWAYVYGIKFGDNAHGFH